MAKPLLMFFISYLIKSSTRIRNGVFTIEADNISDCKMTLQAIAFKRIVVIAVNFTAVLCKRLKIISVLISHDQLFTVAVSFFAVLLTNSLYLRNLRKITQRKAGDVIP